MKNFKNMKMEELGSEELKKTNGGILGLLIGGMITGYKMEAIKNGEPWYWPAFVPYKN